MTVIRRGQTEAQSDFKIISLIKSVLTLCMTYLGIFFPHYSLNLGFFFLSDRDIVLINKYNLTECLASTLREFVEYREASTQMYLAQK